MNKREYQRHISEAFRREQEEIAEAKNKIDIEIRFLQLQDSRDLLRIENTKLKERVKYLESRIYFYK